MVPKRQKTHSRRMRAGRFFLRRAKWLIIIPTTLGLLSCGQDESQSPLSAPQYVLSYAVSGHGSLEGPTRQVVAAGQDGQEVTAVAAEGSRFVAWSDGLQTPERIDRKVTQDLTVTAEFTEHRYNVSYTATGPGRIDGPTSQSVKHGQNADPVTAVPNEGARFEGWNDGLETPERIDQDVTGDLSLIAEFDTQQYTLSYRAEGPGRLDGPLSQTVEHGDTAVPVTAVSDEGARFLGWSDGLEAPTRTDRDVTGDISVTAEFSALQYDLTYSVAGPGRIEGPARQTVSHGMSAKPVTAVPDEGARFAGWSDGWEKAERTDQKVTSDRAVTAKFVVNQYTLTYLSGPNGQINGPTTQTVTHGDDGRQVVALADEGYHFTGWSDGLTTPERRDLAVTGNIEVEASFAVNTYTVSGQLRGLAEGTTLVVKSNKDEELRLAENGSFSFSEEWLEGESYVVEVIRQPTSPNQVCTVNSGSGSIAAANIIDIVIDCEVLRYRVGGTVNGLGKDLKIQLQINENETVEVQGSDSFSFPTPLEDGSTYNITVLSVPDVTGLTCDVDNASGALAGDNVEDVSVLCYIKPVLDAMAGIGKVRLTWNYQDFEGATFKLCRAREHITPDSIRRCRRLEDGLLAFRIVDSHVFDSLTNDVTYWFRLEVRTSDGQNIYSDEVDAVPFGGLNDTGIDWCADNISNQKIDRPRSEKIRSCNLLAGQFTGQDGLKGRDASARDGNLQKTGNGPAGFDFTKVCRNGDDAGKGRCPPNPLSGNGDLNWGCLRDNVTGLTWEIKTESGLQAQDSTYSWYASALSDQSAAAGVQNAGECNIKQCDTESYVAAVNDLELCGLNGWRLPTRKELLSIVDNGRSRPALDPRYFPNTKSEYYWSSSEYADQVDSAWQVYFLYGETYPDSKKLPRHLRLVNGKTKTFGMDNR